MELALYHSKLGYYTKKNKRVGKDGDFITSVSIGKCYGTILARYFYSLQIAWYQITCTWRDAEAAIATAECKKAGNEDTELCDAAQIAETSSLKVMVSIRIGPGDLKFIWNVVWNY